MAVVVGRAVDDDNDKIFKKNNDNVGGKKKLVGWGKWGRGRDRGAVPTWFTNTLLPPTLRLGEIFSGISYPPLFLVTDTFAKSVHSILSKCDTFTPIKRIYLSLLLSLSLCSSLPCESRPGESGN